VNLIENQREDKRNWAPVLYESYKQESLVYSQRMDSATSWSVALLSVLFTIGLTSRGTEYLLIFPIAIVVAVIFLNMEAIRNWRAHWFSDSADAIVTSIYTPTDTSVSFEEGSTNAIVEAIEFKRPALISHFQSIGRRVLAVYIWLFFLCSFAWIYKLLTSPPSANWMTAVSVIFIALILISGIVLAIIGAMSYRTTWAKKTRRYMLTRG
jgi:uncharacterized membrane protein